MSNSQIKWPKHARTSHYILHWVSYWRCVKNTLESVANTVSGTTENVGNNNNNSNHSNTTTTESNRFGSMWKMASAGVKVANAARNKK